MTGIALIHDFARAGRCSPADAAYLIELRRQIAWRRQPWWSRLATFVWRVFA